MKFKINADVLYSRYYELTAANKKEAGEMVENEEVEPVSQEQATSPVLVHIQEIRDE